MSKLTKAGQANSIMVEQFDPRTLGAGHWPGNPRFVAHWEWKGVTRRVSRLSSLERIGPGYVVMTDTGEVFNEEPSEAQMAEPLFQTE